MNLSQNLKWQVRGLDENKVPVSDYTKPRLLHKGEMYKLNWQNKGDEYKLEDFTRREYATYLVAKDVEISPLKSLLILIKWIICQFILYIHGCL